MPERKMDRLKQAQRDLLHAKMDLKEGFYKWACFSAQQAAEKALKAVYQSRNEMAWGHSVKELLEGLREFMNIMPLLEGAKIPDKYYIPARYPNGFATGAPVDYFTEKEAREAVGYAEQIIRFCADNLA
ncbi:HEPN domain-containing protein [Desulfofundulus thermocisternus]|uniref:HEPN domain-containing protein n=1 Tax=Desulfofundulus thermocisternus TaxID=42471 RepID=UPI00217EC9DD|nr:HEPN domain-containing protein [Desulfofundulus thermocisternus]MCS5696628.1 HEPN domain-containing protein [Desulfofundulus thermocisternus]